MGRWRFDPQGNVIVLRASVEGRTDRAPYLHMALDTGASLTVIPWEVADALGLDPAKSRRRTQFMTGSGVELAPVVVIDAMEVLGVRLSHVPVLCHDLPQGSLVDGLLGLSFLKRCRLAIDFRRGILELAESR